MVRTLAQAVVFLSSWLQTDEGFVIEARRECRSSEETELFEL